MLCKTPKAIMVQRSDEPPYENRGRGTPITGIMPVHIPTFMMTWVAIRTAMPVETVTPKRSLALLAILRAARIRKK